MASKRRELSEVQKLMVSELERVSPRTIFVRPGKDEHDPLVVWSVPGFVRPFADILAKMVDSRNRAIEEKHPLSVGLLSHFLRLSTPYAAGTGDKTRKEQRRLLSALIDVDTDELNLMQDAADRELQ